MKLIKPDKEEDVEPTAPPLLYPITGGKPPQGFNWLSGLTEGTIFLCRPYHHTGKPRPPFMEEYHIIRQYQHATKLLTNLNQDTIMIVDPMGFCAIMELVEVIMEGTNE